MTRSSFFGFLIPAALVLALAAGAASAHDHGEAANLTVTGEILDLACYIAHGGKGAQHAKCALKCAEQGQPLGLLAGDGKVYLLLADHADLTAYNKAKTLAGQQVEIKGEAASRDGLTGLTVLAVRRK
jgi:hypothetical protein